MTNVLKRLKSLPDWLVSQAIQGALLSTLFFLVIVGYQGDL